MDVGAVAVEIPEEGKSGNVNTGTNCPHGIQFLESYNRFVFNLSPKDLVGDFAICSTRVHNQTESGDNIDTRTKESEEETLLLCEKHLSSVAILDAVSKSEVVTLDGMDSGKNVCVSCPPVLDDLATIDQISYSSFHILYNDWSYTIANQSDPSLKSKCNKEIQRSKKGSSSTHTKVADFSTKSSNVSITFVGDACPLEKTVILCGVSVLIYALKRRRKRVIWCQVIVILLIICLVIFLAIRLVFYDVILG